jgi:hypothetical protein
MKLGVLLIAGACAADVSAQVWCEVEYSMDNRFRHVKGEVNVECPALSEDLLRSSWNAS